MKKRTLASVVLVLTVSSSLVGADAPPPSLRGEVHDARSGKPIPSVLVVSYYDNSTSSCESMSGADGAYRVAVGDGACVVFHALGYRAKALRWPHDLTPSKDEKRRGLEIRVVKLEPMPTK